MFAPALITASGYHDVKQLLLIIFDKIPQRKGCLCWASFESGQIKATMRMGSSREPTCRSNDDNPLGMGLWRRFSPILTPSSGCQAADFHHNCMVIGFQGYHGAGEESMWIEQVKTPQSSLFLPRFNKFSWINIPKIVASLWFFSVLKKLILTIFPVFSLLLWGRGFSEVLTPPFLLASFSTF